MMVVAGGQLGEQMEWVENGGLLESLAQEYELTGLELDGGVEGLQVVDVLLVEWVFE